MMEHIFYIGAAFSLVYCLLLIMSEQSHVMYGQSFLGSLSDTIVIGAVAFAGAAISSCWIWLPALLFWLFSWC